MALVGVDIGTSYCVLATIQKGAVTIVRNELSERLTPALIGYTEQERHIGEAAQTFIKSNFQNTCRHIKQLMGLTSADLEDIDIERQYSLAPIQLTSAKEGGLAGFSVTYQNKQQIFSATRCLAALLTNLRDTAERSLKMPVHDVVISVPVWYSDRARQAVLDAAKIAGLNCLRTMNEHAATALDYGIYRSNTFAVDTPSKVLFVSVGHGSTTLSFVHFTRGHLRVVAVITDKMLGGRQLDALIMQHFAAQFQKQHNLDPLKYPKSKLKLEEAATKLKKILSANSEAPFNIECLLEECDLNGLMTRQEFEVLCNFFREKLNNLMNSLFTLYALSPDEVEHVEIVGGCCRTPWIQETITKFFNNRLPLSRTLNMDESVARGCALQAAMLDPRYRVREFHVGDRLFDPVTVSYYSSTIAPGHDTPELKTSILFDRLSMLGMRKWLTFNRSTHFDIQLIPGVKGHPLISHVELPQEGLQLDFPKRVKLALKLTNHGTVEWESAQLWVDEQVEEVVTEKSPNPVLNGTTNLTDTAQSEANSTLPQNIFTHSPDQSNQNINENSSNANISSEKNQPQQEQQSTNLPSDKETVKSVSENNQVVKNKVKTRKFDCIVNSEPRLGYLEPSVISALREYELQMIQNDMKEFKRRESMNDLESYIYRTLDQFSQNLKDFATSQEYEICMAQLQKMQDWLYDNMNGSQEMFESELKSLKECCEPVCSRQIDYFARKDAIQEMVQALNELKTVETSPAWNHIEIEKMRLLITKVDETYNWLKQVALNLEAQQLSQPPVITSQAIRKETEMLINFSKTILIPKPEPAVAPNQTSKTPQGDREAPSTQETDLNDVPSTNSPEPTNFNMNNDTDMS